VRKSALGFALIAAVSVAGCSSTQTPRAAPPTPPTEVQAPNTPPSGAPVDRAAEAEVHAEYFDRYHSCLAELGITVTPTEDGGFEVDPGAGGDAALAEADAACKARLGDPPDYAPVTREELTKLYDTELATRDCLEANGYDVREPPSREEFIESYLGDQAGIAAWSSYTDVLDPTEIEDTCPQPTLG